MQYNLDGCEVVLGVRGRSGVAGAESVTKLTVQLGVIP
ncbi:hypothetical protein MCP1_30090 [Candidatus Terasakiella magnetica]|nr:hypothetical protein MCP1_30090 [Candidatus Terasakiella magnetica]